MWPLGHLFSPIFFVHSPSIWGDNVSPHDYSDQNALPTGYSHIGIFANDVYEFCERLSEYGVSFIKKPDEGVAHGNAFVADPDGYWIGKDYVAYKW